MIHIMSDHERTGWAVQEQDNGLYWVTGLSPLELRLNANPALATLFSDRNAADTMRRNLRQFRAFGSMLHDEPVLETVELRFEDASPPEDEPQPRGRGMSAGELAMHRAVPRTGAKR